MRLAVMWANFGPYHNARLRALNEVFQVTAIQLTSTEDRRGRGEAGTPAGLKVITLLGGHYEWADVFVLPSLCEGSATVCYEALAAGLPVITTPNAGSVVRDGIDGFIVPIRNADAIAARLERLITEPGLLNEMSRNARLRAAEFTIAKYGERLLSTVQNGLFNHC